MSKLHLNVPLDQKDEEILRLAARAARQSLEHYISELAEVRAAEIRLNEPLYQALCADAPAAPEEVGDAGETPEPAVPAPAA